MSRYRPFRSLNPDNYNIFVAALVLLAATIIVLVLFSMLLSMLSCPGTILLAIALAVLVFLGSQKQKTRELRIHSGRCSACGYDLRASPDRCPECGRDATIDEPAWRRLRRLREAELRNDAAVQPHPDTSASVAPSVVAQNRERLRAASPLPPTQ